MAEKKTPEEIQIDLKYVLDHFYKEDQATRERLMRVYKKLKFYWSGFARIWWSETAHDWRINNLAYDASEGTKDAQFYDKQVNVFKAYLDSIIAAMSVTIPPVSCYPDDAENPADIETAKAGDRIASLMYKHADAPYLWLHALFIYCTEGTIFAHNYTKTSKEYGTYKVDEYEEAEEYRTQEVCAICKMFPGDEFLSAVKRNTFGPDNQDIGIDAALKEGDICPNCGVAFIPELQSGKIPIKRLVNQRDEPKARQCIEVHGGLFVKTALYAQCQKDTPYLIYSYETHYSNVLERYPELWDRFGKVSSNSGYDNYERWARISTQYMGMEPRENPTVRNAWLRCSAFNILEKEKADRLKKLYPDGVKVVFVNEHFAEACNEALDDHWTATRNPLADYLTDDPLGLLLTSVQDITNDLISLTLQTIEHGIPQTWVDPAVVDLDAYKQSEVLVGGVYPATPAAGKSVADAFHEVKTAQLSGEVLPFAERVQQLGQMASGALPSLFGGAQPNSSKTAAQYSMSRSQAMQRLQNPWKMLAVWWKTVFSKVIPAYIQDIQSTDDERNVVKGTNGNFLNVFVRRAQLQGKIGSVELEANENLPISWAQKKDVIMQMMASGNPQVMELLAVPKNRRLVAQAIGLEDFEVPGTEDVTQQLEEIQLLLQSEPIIEMDPMTGQEMEMPSIPVDFLVDNHEIGWDTCREWLVGESGRLAKQENPKGYKNVLLHGQQHFTILTQGMMNQNAAGSANPQEQQKPGEKEKPEPVAAQAKKNNVPE